MTLRDKRGVFRTRSLFVETHTGDDTWEPPYSLKAYKDNGPVKSLHKMYMEANDPTEYKFAKKAFSSWEHWEALCKCTWFEPIIASWRRELQAKIHSVGVEQVLSILAEAKETGATRLQAAKYLASLTPSLGSAQKAEKPKPKAKSPAERIKEKRASEDFARLGLDD